MVRYIYNQRQCGNCKGCVRTWDMSSRTVYACETCQPLDLGSGVGEGAAPLKLAASRALAMQVCAHLPGRRCHGTSSHIKSSHFITHQIITLHHTSNQHTHHTSSRFPTLPANTHCDVRSLAGFGALPQRSMSWASRLAELDPFFLSSNELGCLEGVGS